MKSARSIPYILAALLLPGSIGLLRLRMNLSREPSPLVPASAYARPAAKFHDPAKPTVAIVAGTEVTEITDLLGPYEVFARAGRYNVYTVASSNASAALTGGLRMRPHYSFVELDSLLQGQAPDIVVAPNLTRIESPQNRPVVDWVRRSADSGAMAFSWCAGAAVLAEAGLLDGRPATSHWGDLSRLERTYPRVDWRRGVRWIDNGQIVASAGITSGIDATLRVIARLEGKDVARRIAQDMRYPNFQFALQPEAEQYRPRLSDAVLFLNAGFKPNRSRIGVALYDGVGELDVSAVYDAHAAAGVADVQAVAAEPGLIVTEHGLWLEPALVPSRDAKAMGRLDRVIVPGREGRSKGGPVVREIANVTRKAPEYLQADSPDRFSLEPVLEDLSRTTDIPTATFAQRRLEYRSGSLALDGAPIPFATLLTPLVLAALGLLLVTALVRLQAFLRMRRRRERSSGDEFEVTHHPGSVVL